MNESMSDVENTDRPRPVHPRCSAADGPQAPGDPGRSADATSDVDALKIAYDAFQQMTPQGKTAGLNWLFSIILAEKQRQATKGR